MRMSGEVSMISWKDNKELRKWLYEQVGELEDTLEKKQYWDACLLLLHWVGSNICFSHRDLLLDHSTFELHDLLRKSLNAEGGVWCAGTATIYAGLVNLFPGLYAAKYGYGLHAVNLTHTTTLVTWKGGKVYNLDVYLGYTWQQAGSERILSFWDVLARVRRGNYESIYRKDLLLKRRSVGKLDDDGRSFKWLFPNRELPTPTILGDRKIWNDAQPCWNRLYARGTPNRKRAEEVRGSVSFNHFMLDLMLKEPQLSRFAPESSDVWVEFNAMREGLFAMMEE